MKRAAYKRPIYLKGDVVWNQKNSLPEVHTQKRHVYMNRAPYKRPIYLNSAVVWNQKMALPRYTLKRDLCIWKEPRIRDQHI